MKQLIITQDSLYQVSGINYFKFTLNNNVTFRDINVILEKNDKYVLDIIARYCELDYKGLKKKDLIDLIEKSNCLVIQ
jgi:hypothetical protein